MRNLTETNSTSSQKGFIASFIAFLTSIVHNLMSVFSSDDTSITTPKVLHEDQEMAQRPKVAQVAVVATIDPEEEDPELATTTNIGITLDEVVNVFQSTIMLQFPNIGKSYTLSPPPLTVTPRTSTTEVLYQKNGDYLAAAANEIAVNVYIDGLLTPENTGVSFIYQSS